MTTLTLMQSVMAHGESISEIVLQEPTGKDVREIGYPYQVNPDESVKLLASVVAKYLVRLGNLPPSTVDTFSPVDFNQAGWIVAGFFLASSRQST